MASHDFRIARVQQTLRRFENDVPLLNMRVKELSSERQESARKFAAALIDETRAELTRLLQEQPEEVSNMAEPPCEPAD
jgi:primosomal protein N''